MRGGKREKNEEAERAVNHFTETPNRAGKCHPWFLRHS